MNKPKTIHDLETPALLIDMDRVEKNAERGQAIADREGVELWFHGKTSKCPTVWDVQKEAGAQGITVATPLEAETAVKHGHEKVLVAYPVVDPISLARIRELTSKSAMSLLVNDEEHARIVRDFFPEDSSCPDILLAVKTGLPREGIRPSGRNMRVVMAIQEMFRDKFRGISTHEGHTYGARNRVIGRGQRARDDMISFAEKCRRAGVNIDRVAMGSSPYFPHFRNRHKKEGGGITELHSGNYVFNDKNAIDLGAANPEDCAVTVLAMVTARSRDVETSKSLRGREFARVYFNSGSKSYSSDKMAHSPVGMSPFFGGIYTDLSATDLRPILDGRIDHLSEEIGWVLIPSEDFDLWPYQCKVRVLPQHSCTAVAMNRGGWFVRGDEVIEPFEIEAAGH